MSEVQYTFLTEDLFSKFGFGDGDMLNEFFAKKDIPAYLHDALFYETIRFILREDLRYFERFLFLPTFVTTAHNSLRILERDSENVPAEFDWSQLALTVTLSEDEVHEAVNRVMTLSKLHTLMNSSKSALRLIDYQNGPSYLIEELKFSILTLEGLYHKEENVVFGEPV